MAAISLFQFVANRMVKLITGCNTPVVQNVDYALSLEHDEVSLKTIPKIFILV